jgi:DNA-binding PadR family transcriptional regulator
MADRKDQQGQSNSLSERLQALEHRLQVEVQTRDTETSDLYRQIAALRSEVEELRYALRAGQSEATVGSAVDLGGFPREWRTEASLETLRIIGSTGQCRHRDLIQALQRSGVVSTTDLRSGSSRRPFERLLQHGLIEAILVSQEAGGRPVSLFRLTAAGQNAYGRLWGQPPAESSYDRLLRRHRSPQHVLLNLQAAEIPRGWADSVDPYPSRLQVPGLGVFDPDIVPVVGFNQRQSAWAWETAGCGHLAQGRASGRLTLHQLPGRIGVTGVSVGAIGRFLCTARIWRLTASRVFVARHDSRRKASPAEYSRGAKDVAPEKRSEVAT